MASPRSIPLAPLINPLAPAILSVPTQVEHLETGRKIAVRLHGLEKRISQDLRPQHLNPALERILTMLRANMANMLGAFKEYDLDSDGFISKVREEGAWA